LTAIATTNLILDDGFAGGEKGERGNVIYKVAHKQQRQ
jgi:hypothetical protein